MRSIEDERLDRMVSETENRMLSGIDPMDAPPAPRRIEPPKPTPIIDRAWALIWKTAGAWVDIAPERTYALLTPETWPRFLEELHTVQGAAAQFPARHTVQFLGITFVSADTPEDTLVVLNRDGHPHYVRPFAWG